MIYLQKIRKNSLVKLPLVCHPAPIRASAPLEPRWAASEVCSLIADGAALPVSGRVGYGGVIGYSGVDLANLTWWHHRRSFTAYDATYRMGERT
jgi:hypothetical protein